MDNIWRYVYCPLRMLAWKAATKVLQLLSATLGVVQGLYRILYCLPPSVFCLPLLPLPSGVQSRVMRVMLLGSSLSMCPIHLHFLAVFMTRVLGHKILRIFSRRMCAVSVFFSDILYNCYVSSFRARNFVAQYYCYNFFLKHSKNGVHFLL